MEEHTPQPGAEEQKKPQNETVDHSEEALTEDQQTPAESPSEETENVETATPTPKEKEVTTSSEDVVSENSEGETKEAEEKQSKASEEKEVDYTALDIEGLIDAYRNLSTGELWLKQHKTLQTINMLFEEKLKADVDGKKKLFLEEGGNEIDFFFKPEYKNRFDQISYEYRKKRRTHYKEQEAAQKVNSERKKAIIEEIKNLIDKNQIDSKTYKTFRTLQESWYTTGQVPRNESQNLWETFKHHVERFYAFLHLDREFRELDHKHNYEEKLKIIERAEALQEYPDIIKASRDLNILHQQWKNDLGPVAKEHREDLWTRFQNASKIIQSRRQEYQKDVAGAMKENLNKKEALLKEMQMLLDEDLETHNAWQNALKKFNALREEFKTIGYVPAKESKASWKTFRDVGTEFMRKKNVFYKEQKKAFNDNIDSKNKLIERSKEVLELEDWDSKVQVMKDIQKEWKTVGFVPRKLDNKLWKEFSDVQKEYFDRLKSGYQRLTSEQEALLKEKTALLEKVKTQDFTPEVEIIKKEYFDQWETWKNLGSLDSKNEAKMNQSFSHALMRQIKNSGLEKKDLNLVVKSLQATLLENNPERLDKEFQAVRTNLSNLKAELTQLENNLEFFSNSSSENPLYKSVEKQIESCQKKIDKAHEEYISLKQIKNAQEKLAREAEAAKENAAEDQESGEDA